MLKTFYSYCKISFFSNTAYRMECILGIINTSLQVFIYSAIWKVLYSNCLVAHPIPYEAVVTNFIISLGLSNTFLFDEFYLYRKINDGTLALELLKPISLRVHMLASNVGTVFFKLMTNFVPTLLLAIFFLDFQAPIGMRETLLFCLSIILGFFVLWEISMLIQTTAFWIINVWSITVIKNVFVNLLSGALLPIWFMPDKMQKIIKFTPFDTIFFSPIKIYLGLATESKIIFDIAKQIIWILLLHFLGLFWWKKGLKKIVIQGG